MSRLVDPRVLILGSPRDPTFLHTVQAMTASGARFAVLDIDAFARGGHLSGSLDEPTSLRLHTIEKTWRLASFRSCYARFVDLPEGWEGPAENARMQALQVAISSLDAFVVNRPTAGESNSSKPYQTVLLRRHGFDVPRSFTTNEPRLAGAFLETCPAGAIYKSNSAQRSIVQAVEVDDLDRLHLLVGCPVYFQERIRGSDVRVHVLRDQCFSVEIRSEEVDYRYDRSDQVTEGPHQLPPDIADRCVRITRSLGLEFSGIDFVRSDADRRYYALEVNPMPGYHGYDLTLRGAISRRLCGQLVGSAASS